MRFELQTTAPEELLEFFRVSTRLDRAVQLVDFVVEESQGLYLVKSQSKPDKEYVVDLADKTCECADWVFRGSINSLPCKHQLAAYLSAHRKPTQ